MKEWQIEMLFNMLYYLIFIGIVAAGLIVIFLTFRYIVKMKDDILKEREEAKTELLEIQAAKSIEWDKYKELQDNLTKLQTNYVRLKTELETLKEEKAKLAIDKDNLKTALKVAKKETAKVQK